jgi:4-azaleucine resistance transporter AzlC
MTARADTPGDRVSVFSLLSLSLPVAMGYVPLGAVFGFLLVQAGAAWWIGPFMSVLVFAGAAQFMAVPLLAAGVPLIPIAVATLVINLRHIFYGLSLLQRAPANRWARGYLIWALTDETYSVITALPPTATTGQIVGVAALNHFWWILGTFIGTAVGARVSTAYTGIDFALAALFAVLVVEQWRATRTLVPIAVAVGAYFVASWAIPSQALAISIALCVIAGVLLARREAAPEAKV